MAALIETTYGRARLIAGTCDPRQPRGTYNQAAQRYSRTAGKPPATWSPELLQALE